MARRHIVYKIIFVVFRKPTSNPIFKNLSFRAQLSDVRTKLSVTGVEAVGLEHLTKVESAIADSQKSANRILDAPLGQGASDESRSLVLTIYVNVSCLLD
jgi:predicted regulator of amino acid metabolism with ACT domain